MFSILGILKYGILLTKRGLLLNIVFSFVFYASYFVFSYYIPLNFIPSGENRSMVQAAFNFIIAITLIVAAFLIHRIKKLHVIYVCSICSSVLAASLFVIPSNTLRILILFAIAIFFGAGQLAFLVYFWGLTVSQERGRVAGFIAFISFLFHPIMYALIATTLDFPRAVALGIILSVGALIGILVKSKKAVLTAKKTENGQHPEKRTILFYLIPWLLFSLINATLAKNISYNISQQVVPSLYLVLTIVQAIGTIFGTLSGGFIADFFGRRMSLAFSLTLYGISSAIAGISGSTSLLYFVYITNGLSWGILLTMYTFVVWGDLASTKNCAKMYAIGFVSFYLAQGIGLLPLEQILQIPLVVSSLVSCLIIFLSNIPIFLAPELLSPDFTEKLRMKLHLSTIKKIKRRPNQG